MISTRDLSSLPGIPHLRRLCQSLAMLDAIIEPEWEMRYYSFDAYWRAEGELASMKNGSGDDYSISFSPAGVLIRGFAHESPMSPYRTDPPLPWPGVWQQVPSVFAEALSDAALSMANTTFCIWRTHSDSSWQRGHINFPKGSDPDGSAALLALLYDNPQTYQQWAQDYYECPVSLTAVTHIYQHHPLSQEIVTLLNEKLDLIDAESEAHTIGYTPT